MCPITEGLNSNKLICCYLHSSIPRTSSDPDLHTPPTYPPTHPRSRPLCRESSVAQPLWNVMPRLNKAYVHTTFSS
ncbi:hypothetical protein E2C01_084108 [Portunus trituberculatus]|uniref:Uncharacterized protein n=1 Tax=Portunus trituberculatus TaxID=210409 RepID=A0A5B7J3Z9_PORTR|nr:hypothetical protein [Portunus trituberculatus]